MAARERKELAPPIRSGDEAREKGRKGGKASGETRRRKKALREHLEALLHAGRDNGLTTAEAVTLALVDKALAGDVRAFEVIRDTIGENPKQVVQADVSGGLVVAWRQEGGQ